MNIRYLKQGDIDRQKWDDTIARSLTSVIYANSWYLDVVSPNWDALVLGDYEAVMPITWRRKWSIKYAYQPFFTQQLGVFSTSQTSAALVSEFLYSVPRELRFVDINLNTGNEVGEDGKWQLQKRLTHHLDLNDSYDSIAQSFTENRKRDLKKAAAAGVRIIEMWDTNEFVTGLRGSIEEKVKGLAEPDWKILPMILHTAQQHGCAKYFGAVVDDQVVATDSILTTEKFVVYFAGFSTATGKETGAPTALFDYIIKTYSGQNRLLDFEGSMIPGIARFFKSIGGVEVPYWRVSMNRLPWPLKLLKR